MRKIGVETITMLMENLSKQTKPFFLDTNTKRDAGAEISNAVRGYFLMTEDLLPGYWVQGCPRSGSYPWSLNSRFIYGDYLGISDPNP